MDEIMGWDEDKISCFSIEIWDSWAFMCLVGLPLGQSSVTCMSSHTKQPFNGCCFDKLMHWCIWELSLPLLSRPSSHSSRLAAVNKAVCIAKCLSVIYHKHNLCQYSQYQSIETILCRPNPIRIKWMTTCPTRTSPNHLTMRKIPFFLFKWVYLSHMLAHLPMDFLSDVTECLICVTDHRWISKY